MAKLTIQGKSFIQGTASGVALATREPLSFWGGYDWKTGEIIDRRHPLSGMIAKDKILVIPFTRGSLSPPLLIFSLRLHLLWQMNYIKCQFR
jgi:cis-L-3-hydroxyproline dehydratase